MTVKQYSRLRPKRSKTNRNRNGAIAIMLGIALLLTVKNINTAFKLTGDRQLISISSATFASSKYQPLEIGSIAAIDSQNLAQIDDLAKNIGYSGTSVAELADILEPQATTELEKARIIYAWIAQHITYDVPAFLNAVNNDIYPDIDPQKVLRDRTTICSGYSNLYYALAKEMNLESAIIIGYAKGATANDEKFQDINHAWNGVKIDGAWYLLDATWGAGSTQEDRFVAEYKPYYFATAPHEFINSHFPQDRGWQLLVQTYSRDEFDRLPDVTSQFYSLGLAIASHHNDRLTTSERIDIKLEAPSNIVATAKLELATEELENAILIDRQGEYLVVRVAPPQIGTYDLTIYAKDRDDPGYYRKAIKYQIDATQPAAKLPTIYSHFHQHRASLIEPLQANLRSNWTAYFNLIVPQATDVQVINTRTQQWTPLNKYGNYFAGHVELNSGEVSVVAKFPGDDRYWHLVEYLAE